VRREKGSVQIKREKPARPGHDLLSEAASDLNNVRGERDRLQEEVDQFLEKKKGGKGITKKGIDLNSKK